jgi:energy-coupling factor transport system ATP-binding protein
MAELAIQVRDLSFSWSKGEQVFKSLSLEVPRGEFWMLLGVNGSGKSTLLRLLANLLTPQSGQMQILHPVGFVPKSRPSTGDADCWC